MKNLVSALHNLKKPSENEKEGEKGKTKKEVNLSLPSKKKLPKLKTI
jgi:hypothetical protein